MTPRYPWLCAAALLIVCMSLPFAVTVEAKGKKGKSSISRRILSRSAGHHLRGARATSEFLEPAHTVVPDQIEVMENGSSRISELARFLSPAPPRNPPSTLTDSEISAPRSRSVSIESGRVIQIQQSLARQGFYSGEMSGSYDEATASAMRRFQAYNKIAATGYPTAAALKRLGLTNW